MKQQKKRVRGEEWRASSVAGRMSEVEQRMTDDEPGEL